MDSVKNGLGIAGAGKYMYQAARVAQGMGSTTPLTAALDIASGTVGTATAAGVSQAIKSSSSLTKGLVGAGKISELGKVTQFAAKISPFVSRGAAALGVVLGGVEVGKGVKNLKEGQQKKGLEHIVSGSCDIVTQAALGVSCSTTAEVAGVPVAAVALGVAGVAQAGKYAFKFRENIGKAAQAVGSGVSRAAKAVGRGTAHAAKTVSMGAAAIAQKLGIQTKASVIAAAQNPGLSPVKDQTAHTAALAKTAMHQGSDKLSALFK